MNARLLPLIALLVGLALGWSLRGESEAAETARRGRAADSRPEASTAIEERPAPRAREDLRTPKSPPARVEAPPTTPADTALIPDALWDYARSGIIDGWRELRADRPDDATLEVGLERFEELVLALPGAIGRTLGQEANEADEARAAGEAFAILLDLSRGGEPRLDLARDRDAMEELYARRFPEAVAHGLDHQGKLSDAIADGVTLHLPPGVFKIDERDLERSKTFPRDVTIAGSGKDATLLLLEDMSMRSKLRNFALRDCTVYVEDGLFDLRREPALFRMDRVRIVGQDCGHGGCSMLDAPGMVLLAVDCEILGGFGSSPGNGQVFGRGQGGALKRFDGCRIQDQHLGMSSLSGSDTVVFAGCDLVRMLEPIEEFAATKPGVELNGCFVTYAEDGAKPTKRDLNELFPQWKSRIERL